jgi:hypothetical protein
MAIASKKKLVRAIFGAALGDGLNVQLAALDEKKLDRLILKEKEIRIRFMQSNAAIIKDLSLPEKFRSEETESTHGYFSGYEKPKPVAEQVNILRGIFPNIGFADEKLAKSEVPQHAEGWFAIPKWQIIAPTYVEAVQKVLGAIKKVRPDKFYNYRKHPIDNERLRQTAKTTAMFQQLSDVQKGHDVLIVAAQFGLSHGGLSVRRAREVFAWNEFGLGSFAVGIMLLTHPERLSSLNDLWIDCAGDEYDDLSSGILFSHAPHFSFRVNRVGFDMRWFNGAKGNYGSASGFLPQE